MVNVLEKAAQIKLVVFDVDGVLTDGRLYLDPQGVVLKVFHVHDGLGIQLLLENGIEVAVISGGTSPVVTERLSQLGVQYIYQGQTDKLSCLNRLQEQLQLTYEQIAYVGDDLPDVSIIQVVGLGIAVANAREYVKQHADWETSTSGGYGAAREVCDLILEARNFG